MSHNLELSQVKRSILIVGKTGAGKSKFLNELIGKRIFKSSASIQSCTTQIECSDWNLIKCKFVYNSKIHELPFELMAYDTPGIADSQGRSKEFLNLIAETIKEEPLNLLIILVGYGKLDTGLQNNLEILRECLNDLSQSTSMLIVNKVPTEKYLERKRKQGEKVADRNVMLEEIFEKLSDALGKEFKFKAFLENDDSDDDINKEKYDSIRQIIYSCSSNLNVSNVRTWNEIVEFYLKEINFDQETQDQLTKLIEELNDQLDKVEWDIADVKYPILISGYIQEINLTNSISKFDCKITQEEYFNRLRNSQRGISKVTTLAIAEINSKFALGQSFGQSFLKGLGTQGIITIEIKLKNLSARRQELKKELEKCQSSVETQKAMVEGKKLKLARLEQTLVNANQNTQDLF